MIRYTNEDTFKNGIDVGMAFDQIYRIHGANCYGCDMDRAMEFVTMNG